ncbi:hypothetical protein GCM10007857_87460 [Bradyrhizobium iriomotense]|uniref:Uncharacterized protein n=1 Tax=Bradyrhizobium iriomotense TaxID=441950 RepID=A0ABQ6BE19_9BRAD|nr:hypothetical protein GCM10007857_87460 [Bradyrhizobium iriomotense]
MALVRRQILKKFPDLAGARGLPGGAQEATSGARRGPNFFQFFLRYGSVCALSGHLTHWNRVNFCDNPLCDDLLTIGVDSPEGGAYNPNH